MDLPIDGALEVAPAGLDPLAAVEAPLPQDQMESLHRAINERRAQLENPELLRNLRSL